MTAFSVPDNLAFDSYGDLSSVIADWMNRNDLTGSVQSMIALAEARMRRELAPLFGEVSASVVTTGGLGALPSDYGTLIRVMYGTRTLHQLSVTAADSIPTSYSEPYVYTIEVGNIRTWPAGAFTLLVLYQPLLPQLSEGNPTTTLLSLHPDLYFYGSMMFAEGFVANDQRADLFKSLWDEALESAKAYFLRQKFAGPLAPRVDFVP
jgi:hypothetical protein